MKQKKNKERDGDYDENENVTSRSRIYQSIQAEGIEILRNSGIFCKAFTEKPVHVFAHEEENFT